MVSEILIVVLAIAVAVAVIWLFRRLAILVLNAITGVVTLLLVNQFHLMSSFGATDIAITPATVLICALGGIPGAIILVLLSLAGTPIA
jgi:inhibitor of the pro-sigma K processing machinery